MDQKVIEGRSNEIQKRKKKIPPDPLLASSSNKTKATKSAGVESLLILSMTESYHRLVRPDSGEDYTQALYIPRL